MDYVVMMLQTQRTDNFHRIASERVNKTCGKEVSLFYPNLAKALRLPSPVNLPLSSNNPNIESVPYKYCISTRKNDMGLQENLNNISVPSSAHLQHIPALICGISNPHRVTYKYFFSNHTARTESTLVNLANYNVLRLNQNNLVQIISDYRSKAKSHIRATYGVILPKSFMIDREISILHLLYGIKRDHLITKKTFSPNAKWSLIHNCNLLINYFYEEHKKHIPSYQSREIFRHKIIINTVRRFDFKFKKMNKTEVSYYYHAMLDELKGRCYGLISNPTDIKEYVNLVGHSAKYVQYAIIEQDKLKEIQDIKNKALEYKIKNSNYNKEQRGSNNAKEKLPKCGNAA